jgi:hypothetical protein
MHYPSADWLSDKTGAAIGHYVERKAMQRVYLRPR